VIFLIQSGEIERDIRWESGCSSSRRLGEKKPFGVEKVFVAAEMHNHVKTMGTAQQTFISRVAALEAFQRDASVLQTVLIDNLAILERRHNAIESSHSAMEAALSDVGDELSGLRVVSESANRCERELAELTMEIRSVRHWRLLRKGLLNGRTMQTIVSLGWQC
jgi:hypothetical protein